MISPFVPQYWPKRWLISSPEIVEVLHSSFFKHKMSKKLLKTDVTKNRANMVKINHTATILISKSK